VSGHSKWATTKHKKGAKDAKRAKSFAKLIRQVEVAAREGGGDLSANASLRTMFQKARDASVPLDTIERAVKRGTGELEGLRYESVTYEGYAHGGVAVIVETLTDNRNRTGPELRNIFKSSGGSMAEPGAVAWQFERRGIMLFDKTISEDDLLEASLEAGADDVSDVGDNWKVTCGPSDLHAVRDALDAAGFAANTAEASLEPTQMVEVGDEAEAHKILRLLDAIDDHDDVQEVHANCEIPDQFLASFEG
jgi:YebC/PmpR family DNA-binding regulatory protein